MAANRRAEVDAAVADVDFSRNDYQIEFDTTKGRIRLNLWPDVAPGHCKNLIGLTRIGYYNGIIVHRVVPGFVMQAGCPEGTGRGGPGYTIKAEFNNRLHETGTLSMARTPDPNSAGSQFFICLARTPSLDGDYTAFGQAADAESLKTVATIGGVKTGSGDRPVQEIRILSGKVTAVPKAAA